MAWLKVLLGILLSLVLVIIPVPTIIHDFRPFWPLLFLLYLLYYQPANFHLTTVFFVGLCMDVLTSTVLGLHGFSLLLAIVIAFGKKRRFALMTLAGQMIFIGIVCSVYACVYYSLEAFMGYPVKMGLATASTALSLFIWPWIKMIADDVFRVDNRRYSQRF